MMTFKYKLFNAIKYMIYLQNAYFIDCLVLLALFIHTVLIIISLCDVMVFAFHSHKLKTL